MSKASATVDFYIQDELDNFLKGIGLIALVTAFILKISILTWSGQAAAQSSEGGLAAASQNPIANLISVPFQNNTLFGLGDGDDTANLLNIQPVIPISLGNWTLINRTIIPVIDFPGLTVDLPRIPGVPEAPSSISVDSTFGLGDINHTTFISPTNPGKLIWGVGPSVTLKTATDDRLGSGKWSAGPSVVVLAQPAPWTIGVLMRQLWSFAGDSSRKDVNHFLMQPFMNYNMRNGWYLVSSPIITANWDADDKWLVPVGGGVGRIFRIGQQPVNATVQAYSHVIRPDLAPEWSLRAVFTLLFPTN